MKIEKQPRNLCIRTFFKGAVWGDGSWGTVRGNPSCKKGFPQAPSQELLKRGYLLYNPVSILAMSLANRHRAVGTLVRYYELTYKTIGV